MAGRDLSVPFTHSSGSGLANDLNLDTGSLEYSNIYDSKRSTSVGGGVTTSGIGTKDGGSPSVNTNYSLSNSTQADIATIGAGNITVLDTSTALGTGGSVSGLEGLNRDTTNTQVKTTDTGMKGSATADAATVDLLTTNPVTTVNNTVDSVLGMTGKAITDGAIATNEVIDTAKEAANWVDEHLITGEGNENGENSQQESSGSGANIIQPSVGTSGAGENDTEGNASSILKSLAISTGNGVAPWDGTTPLNNCRNDEISQLTKDLATGNLADIHGFPAVYGACVFLSTVYGTSNALGVTLSPVQLSEIYAIASSDENGAVGGSRGAYYVLSYQGLADAVATVTGYSPGTVTIPEGGTNIDDSSSSSMQNATVNIIKSIQKGGTADIQFGSGDGSDSNHTLSVTGAYVDPDTGNVRLAVKDNVNPQSNSYIDTSDMTLYTETPPKSGEYTESNRRIKNYRSITTNLEGN